MVLQEFLEIPDSDTAVIPYRASNSKSSNSNSDDTSRGEKKKEDGGKEEGDEVNSDDDDDDAEIDEMQTKRQNRDQNGSLSMPRLRVVCRGLTTGRSPERIQRAPFHVPDHTSVCTEFPDSAAGGCMHRRDIHLPGVYALTTLGWSHGHSGQRGTPSPMSFPPRPSISSSSRVLSVLIYPTDRGLFRPGDHIRCLGRETQIPAVQSPSGVRGQDYIPGHVCSSESGSFHLGTALTALQDTRTLQLQFLGIVQGSSNPETPGIPDHDRSRVCGHESELLQFRLLRVSSFFLWSFGSVWL